MGRELGMNRIDFLRDGGAIIRHNNSNFCGRTEFTNDIASLFYNREVYYLVIDTKESLQDEPFKCHVTVEDDYWSEKEFDIEYNFVDRDDVFRILEHHIDADERELLRERAMIEDAREARCHTTNLKDFKEFSEFIDNLVEHHDTFNETAKDYEFDIEAIEDDIDNHGYTDIIGSYVLLTLSE